ncbi:response regulator [Solitalea lacus]|uniref:response regulator n=1 Tax=Solitalea lacus TaxID=2911172 RepID=UPI001EDC84D9|nr:response regulator transcription factor [Solitalea lacus]UKJ08394.1 response regulator transcription factor [Solitalea lacus]
MQYKLLLADDHELLLEGLCSILRDLSNITVVATAKNGLEVISGIMLHQPHLVLLDLNMPTFDGMQCLQSIKKDFHDVKVLVLTNYNQPELVNEVKKLGANGFMVKNSTAAELAYAIQCVLSGKQHFPTENKTDSVIKNSVFFDGFLRKYQLTKREVNIILQICEGQNTKQIADKLFLSEFTVNTHRRNIMKKLDLKNVTNLILFAKNNQLI